MSLRKLFTNGAKLDQDLNVNSLTCASGISTSGDLDCANITATGDISGVNQTLSGDLTATNVNSVSDVIAGGDVLALTGILYGERVVLSTDHQTIDFSATQSITVSRFSGRITLQNVPITASLALTNACTVTLAGMDTSSYMLLNTYANDSADSAVFVSHLYQIAADTFVFYLRNVSGANSVSTTVDVFYQVFSSVSA